MEPCRSQVVWNLAVVISTFISKPVHEVLLYAVAEQQQFFEQGSLNLLSILEDGGEIFSQYRDQLLIWQWYGEESGQFIGLVMC